MATDRKRSSRGPTPRSYSAKAAGRNRVFYHSGLDIHPIVDVEAEQQPSPPTEEIHAETHEQPVV